MHSSYTMYEMFDFTRPFTRYSGLFMHLKLRRALGQVIYNDIRLSIKYTMYNATSIISRAAEVPNRHWDTCAEDVANNYLGA